MSIDLRAGSARRRIGAIAILVALLSGAVAAGAGCTDQTSSGTENAEPQPDARNGGRLVVGIASPLDDVVPATREWTPSELQFARAVYDSLAVYDDNYELRPELAQSITPNDDFTDWVIELRPDVYFHDGSPLDAALVQRNLEAQRQSPSAGPLMRPVKSIYVTGPLTVHVGMRSPWSTFPHLLTGQPGFIAANASLDADAHLAPPVGTGPFIAEEWSTGAARLRKNSAYWREDLPRLDEVDLRFIGEAHERAEALRAGRLDMILTDDPVDITALDDDAIDDLQGVMDPEVEDPKLTVVFNVSQPPFLDPVARHAVWSATNRQGFDSLRYDDLLAPVRTPFSPQSLWYNDVPLAPHDVAQARTDAATYGEIYGAPLSFTLAVPAEPVPMRFAAEWQRQLTDAGISMQIVPQSRDEITSAASVGAFEAVMLPMWGNWHPDWYYPVLHRAEMAARGAPGSNYPRFGTLGIDSALDLARQSAELADQVDQYRNVQDELASGEAYLFLARLPNAVIAREDVRDLTAWSTAAGPPGLTMQGGTVSLQSVWLDRAERPAE